MSDYLVVAVEGKIEKQATNNLFDAIDIIERFKETGKTVYIVNGSFEDGDDFIKRVRNFYR